MKSTEKKGQIVFTVFSSCITLKHPLMTPSTPLNFILFYNINILALVSAQL